MDSTLIHGFRIGEWQIWPEEGRIAGPDGPQHIEPKVMDVLLCLANRAGRVVARETLLAEVWEGRAVSDEPLSRCIGELRRHFGDSRGQSRFIETIPKRGYKLVGPVSIADDSFQSNADARPDYSAAAHDIAGWPTDAETRFAGLEIVRRLGEGTMAKVFLARESALDRLVAVKVLRLELSSDPLARERFEREAKTAARISHPNVTTIYRVGELSNGTPFIAAEFIEGNNLAEVVAKAGQLGIDESLRILHEVASALECADAKRVIHRDVKPSNVLIEDRTGRVVLSDFGIAGIQESGGVAARRLTRDGERLGDPNYASPEHIRGESLTARSDIYSLGVMVYELLAGRGPFDLASDTDPSAAHVRETPVELTSCRPQVPVAMARLVHACLAKTPQARPSASELLQLMRDTGESTENAASEMQPEPQSQAGLAVRYRHTVLIAALVASGLVVMYVTWRLLT